jgi:hypothetical protein
LCLTPVYEQFDTDDKTAVIRREERDGICDFIRSAHPHHEPKYSIWVSLSHSHTVYALQLRDDRVHTTSRANPSKVSKDLSTNIWDRNTLVVHGLSSIITANEL